MSRSLVENPVVVDGVLRGTVVVPALDAAVEATFEADADDERDDIDTDTVVAAAATIVAKLTTAAWATIVDQVASEVTDSAFSQSDVDEEHAAASLLALRAALRVVRIDLWLARCSSSWLPQFLRGRRSSCSSTTIS